MRAMTEPHEPDTTEVEDVPLAADEQDEQDEQDEAAEAAPEPEPEPEPESIRDDRDFEKALKALEKEAARHADRIVQIMGEDAQTLEPCPLCAPSTPGFRWPVMPEGEQLARVKAAIGEPVAPDYEKDRYSNTCDACKGYGRTRTGSKVPGQGDVTCFACKGRGWIPVGTERASGAITAANGTPEIGTPPVVYGDVAEPPEAAALKALGYIVVPPVPTAS
jgi:hypothetical protein